MPRIIPNGKSAKIDVKTVLKQGPLSSIITCISLSSTDVTIQFSHEKLYLGNEMSLDCPVFNIMYIIMLRFILNASPAALRTPLYDDISSVEWSKLLRRRFCLLRFSIASEMCTVHNIGKFDRLFAPWYIQFASEVSVLREYYYVRFC